jgi:hypothetical protein
VVRQIVANWDALVGGTSRLFVSTVMEGASKDEAELAELERAEEASHVTIQVALRDQTPKAPDALRCCMGLLAERLGCPVTEVQSFVPPLEEGGGMGPEQVRPACGGLGWGLCRRQTAW